MGRREFAPPHIRLNRAQAVTLRQLQTQSYYSPAQMKTWYNIEDMNIIYAKHAKRRYAHLNICSGSVGHSALAFPESVFRND